MPLTNAVWTEEANADDRSKWMPMHNNRRAIAIGCALASFIVLDGFSMLCAAQPATAKVNERLQFLEWCESNGRDIWYDLVIRGCSEVIRVGKETPKDLAFAFTNRGNGYAFKQDYDRAIADYTEAIKLDPDFAAAYNGRAGAYSDQGDVDRAVADYIDARRLALRNAGDRTVSVLQRDHTPAITAVNPQSPIPAATAPGSENGTTVGGTNAMSKSTPILQSSLRGNAYPVLDVQDTEPVVEPGRQPSAAGDAPARPIFNRADNAADPPTAAVGQPGFLFAESNVRYLTRLELQKLSAEQLQIARNEIFARRGRYFKDDRMSSYFARLGWYQPAAWDVPLNPIERANVDLIRSLEAPSAMRSDISRPVPSTKPRSGAKVIRAATIKAE
jgi:tetratricopeptide (TPR) repeat protein